MEDPFDGTHTSGMVVLVGDRLEILTRGKTDLGLFESFRNNIGVVEGRWYYEVILVSEGLLQIGWATDKCVFQPEVNESYISPRLYEFITLRDRLHYLLAFSAFAVRLALCQLILWYFP